MKPQSTIARVRALKAKAGTPLDVQVTNEARPAKVIEVEVRQDSLPLVAKKPAAEKVKSDGSGKPKKASFIAGPKTADNAHHGRLPHGARFDVAYDGEAMKWTGTLTVLVDGKVEVFQDRKSGVHHLLQTLAEHLRKWEKDRATPSSSAATAS